MRGFLEDLDFRRWILRLTGARRAVLDRDALLDSARHGIEEGVRAGITTYADTCDSGVGMQAMREARRSRHHVSGSVRPRSGALRAVHRRTSREGRGSALPRDAPRSRRGFAACAVHCVRRPLSARRRHLAREQKLPLAFTSPRVSSNRACRRRCRRIRRWSAPAHREMRPSGILAPARSATSPCWQSRCSRCSSVVSGFLGSPKPSSAAAPGLWVRCFSRRARGPRWRPFVGAALAARFAHVGRTNRPGKIRQGLRLPGIGAPRVRNCCPPLPPPRWRIGHHCARR